MTCGVLVACLVLRGAAGPAPILELSPEAASVSYFASSATQLTNAMDDNARARSFNYMGGMFLAVGALGFLSALAGAPMDAALVLGLGGVIVGVVFLAIGSQFKKKAHRQINQYHSDQNRRATPQAYPDDPDRDGVPWVRKKVRFVEKEQTEVPKVLPNDGWMLMVDGRLAGPMSLPQIEKAIEADELRGETIEVANEADGRGWFPIETLLEEHRGTSVSAPVLPTPEPEHPAEELETADKS